MAIIYTRWNETFSIKNENNGGHKVAIMVK